MKIKATSYKSRTTYIDSYFKNNVIMDYNNTLGKSVCIRLSL